MTLRKGFTSAAWGLVAGALLYSLGSWAFGAEVFPWLPEVLSRLIEESLKVATWTDLGLTLVRSLTGFLLAFVVGVPLGMMLGGSAWSDRALFLPVVLLQSCPPLFWVIPLVLILGTDGQAPVAVAFLVVLPLVVLAIRDARQGVRPTLRDIFHVYAPSRWLTVRELLLPALAPALRSGLVLGVVLGLKSAVLGEWFASHTGTGRALFRLYGVFDMPGFFAMVFLFLFVAAALGTASEALSRVLFPSRRPYRRPSRSTPTRGVELLPPATVEIQGLSFGWGNKVLFEGVDLVVTAGEVVVVSGPSGSGKTTLARLALGLLHPSHGRVKAPRRPAVLFQEEGLLLHRDVLGNVLLPAWQQKTPQAELHARAALKQVGLEGDEHKYPDELSGGMRQRAALARALMQGPDFVVLDEPFQSLDASSRRELWDLTFRLLGDQGLGALIITHYPEELQHRSVRFWSLPARPSPAT